MLKAAGFLSTRTFLTRLSPPRQRIQWRSASTRVGRPDKRRSLFAVVSGGILLTLGLSPFYTSHIHADAALDTPTDEMSELTLGALVRSYAVYTMCSIPALVDNSPRLLELASLPGIKWLTETFVRITFFDQFVGGDTAQKTVPLLYKLRAANKGALFAYSVEVDEAEAMTTSKRNERPPYKRIVDEMVRCINVAADFEDEISGKVHTGRRTWVAVKMSALLPDANSLVKLSSHILTTRPSTRTPIPFPGCPHSSDLDTLDALELEDTKSIQELHADLVKICTRAQERGVKIIIDAEYSWYQPAIDALTLALSRQFNNGSNVQPLIYGTYQAYLRRTPAQLSQALADAKAHNYSLGVKLVRGAYHPHELAAHSAGRANSLSISPDAQPPVWTTKQETDACYNMCVGTLVRAVRDDVTTRRPKGKPFTPTVGVLFGTHNWASCDLILNELVGAGLGFKGPVADDLVLIPEDVTERVAIGQLYGMSDDLTNYLVKKTTSNTPLIIKYVPYGALSEVMPYLSRRAIENKSVLGDGMAAKERRRAGAEIRRRFFGARLFGA